MPSLAVSRLESTEKSSAIVIEQLGEVVRLQAGVYDNVSYGQLLSAAEEADSLLLLLHQSAHQEPSEMLLCGFLLAKRVCDEISLLDVFVQPSSRGNGAGKLLIAEMHAWGLEHDVSKVLLEVRASNLPAITLYGSQNYKEVARRQNYYRAIASVEDGEGGIVSCFDTQYSPREDAIIMQKILTLIE